MQVPRGMSSPSGSSRGRGSEREATSHGAQENQDAGSYDSSARRWRSENEETADVDGDDDDSEFDGETNPDDEDDDEEEKEEEEDENDELLSHFKSAFAAPLRHGSDMYDRRSGYGEEDPGRALLSLRRPTRRVASSDAIRDAGPIYDLQRPRAYRHWLLLSSFSDIFFLSMWACLGAFFAVGKRPLRFHSEESGYHRMLSLLVVRGFGNENLGEKGWINEDGSGSFDLAVDVLVLGFARAAAIYLFAMGYSRFNKVSLPVWTAVLSIVYISVRISGAWYMSSQIPLSLIILSTISVVMCGVQTTIFLIGKRKYGMEYWRASESLLTSSNTDGRPSEESRINDSNWGNPYYGSLNDSNGGSDIRDRHGIPVRSSRSRPSIGPVPIAAPSFGSLHRQFGEENMGITPVWKRSRNLSYNTPDEPSNLDPMYGNSQRNPYGSSYRPGRPDQPRRSVDRVDYTGPDANVNSSKPSPASNPGFRITADTGFRPLRRERFSTPNIRSHIPKPLQYSEGSDVSPPSRESRRLRRTSKTGKKSSSRNSKTPRERFMIDAFPPPDATVQSELPIQDSSTAPHNHATHNERDPGFITPIVGASFAPSSMYVSPAAVEPDEEYAASPDFGFVIPKPEEFRSVSVDSQRSGLIVDTDVKRPYDSNNYNAKHLSVQSYRRTHSKSPQSPSTLQSVRETKNEPRNLLNYLLEDEDMHQPALLHAAILPAVKAMWNNDFSATNSLLDENDSVLPRQCLHRAEVQMMKRVVSGQPGDNDQIMEMLRVVDQTASRLLDSRALFNSAFEVFKTSLPAVSERSLPKTSDDEHLRQNFRWDCELACADALLYRGIIQVLRGSEIKGVFNLRKTWKIYSRLKSEIPLAAKKYADIANRESGTNSDDKEIHGSRYVNDGPAVYVDRDISDSLIFGIAIFYLIASLIPGTFLTMLKAIGFVPNKVEGVRYCQFVYRRGGIRAPFAAMILLMNYLLLPRGMLSTPQSPTSQEEDPVHEAGQIISECLNSFPNGSSFLILACHYERKRGMFDKGVNHIRRAILSCAHLGAVPNSYLFELAAMQFVALDFSAAAITLEDLFQKEESSDPASSFSSSFSKPVNSSFSATSRRSVIPRKTQCEHRPFCGLLLCASYYMMDLDENGRLEGGKATEQRCLGVLEKTKDLCYEASLDKSGGRTKGPIYRFHKLARMQSEKALQRNRVPPFLALVILYLQRDLAHLLPDDLKRIEKLLERCFSSIQRADTSSSALPPDIRAVHLLLQGAIRSRRDEEDPMASHSVFMECLNLERSLEYELWVVPFCRYELAELYAKLGRTSDAVRELRFILEPRTSTNGPFKSESYEYSGVLRSRCRVALESLRDRNSDLVQPAGE